MTALSEARRQAEEALAAYDRCKGYEAYTYAFDCVRPLRDLLAATEPAAGTRLCACAWCGGALVQDPDAPHRWRCINAEQRKCVARGDWYVLGDDRDYVPAYPASQPDAVREAAERAANDGCGCVRSEPDPDGIGVRILWCPDRWPGDTEQWCWSCQMRAALDGRKP